MLAGLEVILLLYPIANQNGVVLVKKLSNCAGKGGNGWRERMTKDRTVATRLWKVYLSAVSGKQRFPVGFRMHRKVRLPGYKSFQGH